MWGQYQYTLIDALMYLYVYAFIKYWADVNYINGMAKEHKGRHVPYP
jgi:hypothetical protein